MTNIVNPIRKLQCKTLLMLPFLCQQWQEDWRLLNPCQTHTNTLHTHREDLPLAGNFVSQYPVASAAEPRVPEASRMCLTCNKPPRSRSCHRWGTRAWHQQREGTSQSDQSQETGKSMKAWLVERESTWHTYKVAHHIDETVNRLSFFFNKKGF